MNLKSPFFISSRLLPAVKIGPAEISLAFAGTTGEGRTRYRWHVDFADGREFTGNDLKSGVGGGSMAGGFASLLSFMSACGESISYGRLTSRPGENADLFPAEVAAFCDQYSDELTLLELELTEGNLIEE